MFLSASLYVKERVKRTNQNLGVRQSVKGEGGALGQGMHVTSKLREVGMGTSPREGHSPAGTLTAAQ